MNDNKNIITIYENKDTKKLLATVSDFYDKYGSYEIDASFVKITENRLIQNTLEGSISLNNFDSDLSIKEKDKKESS